MTAITPQSPTHANLPPLASRFVKVAEMAWEKSAIYPGIETKTLLVDPASVLLSILLQLQPGAKIPDHEHVLIEQTYVLAGALACASQVNLFGDRRGAAMKRGAGHRAHCCWVCFKFPIGSLRQQEKLKTFSAMIGIRAGATVTMPAMHVGMMNEDADVAFACGMIAHHQGAIDMAQVQMANGKDPDMRTLAEGIIAAQVEEIEQMTKWLGEDAY